MNNSLIGSHNHILIQRLSIQNVHYRTRKASLDNMNSDRLYHDVSSYLINKQSNDGIIVLLVMNITSGREYHQWP